MSKNITEDILLKAGFTKQGQNSFKYKNNKVTIYIDINTYSSTRHWRCQADNEYNNSNTDIQTIEHFNKLMDLMDIDFRLKEE